MTKRKTPAEVAAARSEAAKKAAETRAAKAAAAAAAAATDAAPAGPGEPGPKPRSIVVEDTLKCQTKDGEISLSLLVPYKKIKLVTSIPEDVNDEDMLDFLLEQVIAPDDAETLLGLRDGTETFEFTMAWMDALGERLGASLGKYGPSST